MCTKLASVFSGAFAGAVLLAWGFAAQAVPAAALADGGGVTLVADGCGLGFHRGPEGFCHRNEERIVVAPGVVVLEPGRVCPPGMHLGPHRRECWPN
jgi:hypothetical protein